MFFVLLLCVPTLLAAGAAFRLLLHERERIAGQALAAEETRVRAVAESIQLAVATVEDELTAQLRAMPADRLREELVAWQEANPLIRHVFVWHPRSGLRYPVQDASCTREEQRFVARYEALFSGRLPWHVAPGESAPAVAQQVAQPPAAEQQAPAQQAAEQQQAALVQQVRDIRQTSQQLASLARQRGGPDGAHAAPAASPPARDGWQPWLTDNQLSLLGWVQLADGRVYGVEMEFAALLSRLVAVFPRAVPPGGVHAIVDDAGRLVHRVGDVELADGARPAIAISLSPYLPHWQVASYSPSGPPGLAPARTFLLLAGLLLAILVAAILSGGALLARAAHQSARDARLKTTFVSNVSHELKTPLTSIRMYADLLHQDRVRDPEKRARYLRVIAEESERLTRLVNNVLDFSRLEQHRRTYRPEPVDLAAGLRAFADAHRLRIEGAGLALTVEAPTAPLTVRTDRDALEQALLNLVDNAIKYAAEGRELSLSLEGDGEGARLAICDRGPGVAARDRDRIFEKFYRADDSITARQPGAGLGLSIARGLLREQGDDLTFEPRPGGGSCFVMKLRGGPA